MGNSYEGLPKSTKEQEISFEKNLKKLQKRMEKPFGVSISIFLLRVVLLEFGTTKPFDT